MPSVSRKISHKFYAQGVVLAYKRNKLRAPPPPSNFTRRDRCVEYTTDRDDGQRRGHTPH